MVDPVTRREVAELPVIDVPSGSSLWEMALHGIGDAPRVAPPPAARSIVGTGRTPRWMVVCVTLLVLGFIGAVLAMGTSTVGPQPQAAAANATHASVPSRLAIPVATVPAGTTGGTLPPPVPGAGVTTTLAPSSVPGASGTPPTAPGSCAATMADPTPKIGATDQVSVAGLPAGGQATITLGYSGDATEYTVPIDRSGHADLEISLGQPPAGTPVPVSVAAVSVHCATSFTPS